MKCHRAWLSLVCSSERTCRQRSHHDKCQLRHGARLHKIVYTFFNGRHAFFMHTRTCSAICARLFAMARIFPRACRIFACHLMLGRARGEDVGWWVPFLITPFVRCEITQRTQLCADSVRSVTSGAMAGRSLARCIAVRMVASQEGADK